MKPKVLILINELLRGGAQGIVLDLCRRIDHDRFELVVATLKPSPAPSFLEECRATGVRVETLDGGRSFSLREARALFALLKRERPDVLHTFLPYAGILGRIIGRIAGVRSIVSTQCNLPVAYDTRTYWLDRLTLPLACAWIGATESIERSYGGSYAYFSSDAWERGRRHFSIVSGVDLPTFDARVRAADRTALRAALSVPEGKDLILMIARLVSWKGHHDLLSAFARLSGEPHLALAGWGPLEEELKAQAEREGTLSRVHFLGARSDVPELLAAADFYAQTHCRAEDGTIWMGPNTSQMEACAARVPSISTAVPDIELLIEDGVTGKLAPPNDSGALARALEHLRMHSDEARGFAERARARVEERYSVARMAEAHQSLYHVLSI